MCMNDMLEWLDKALAHVVLPSPVAILTELTGSLNRGRLSRTGNASPSTMLPTASASAAG
jgi:hypothetical protein